MSVLTSKGEKYRMSKAYSLAAAVAFVCFGQMQTQAAPSLNDSELKTVAMDEILSAESVLTSQGLARADKKGERVSLLTTAGGSIEKVTGSFGSITTERPNHGKLISRETTILSTSPIPGLVKTTVEDFSGDLEKVTNFYRDGHTEVTVYKCGVKI
ncbi:MAG: hypothetical protein K2Y32_17345 [Candidatus Obscuribacterales bacterium]|nr:hypothetical protein [Candidatus Obscuribacterales bacterium]